VGRLLGIPQIFGLELPRTPRAASPRLTPPGSKDSKGNWALAGVRGVFTQPILLSAERFRLNRCPPLSIVVIDPNHLPS